MEPTQAQRDALMMTCARTLRMLLLLQVRPELQGARPGSWPSLETSTDLLHGLEQAMRPLLSGVPGFEVTSRGPESRS